MSLGEMPHLSPMQKVVKLFEGLGSYHAFKGLVYTMDRMKRLNNLYANYPKTPEDFPEWKKQADKALGEVKARFH